MIQNKNKKNIPYNINTNRQAKTNERKQTKKKWKAANGEREWDSMPRSNRHISFTFGTLVWMSSVFTDKTIQGIEKLVFWNHDELHKLYIYSDAYYKWRFANYN
jgi:hypothetical protein